MSETLCCHGRPIACDECVRDDRDDEVKWEERRAAGKTPKQERDRLRAALVGLVGVDTREELEQLEAVMRVVPAPAEDKAKTIDAIHALLATLP